MPWGEWGAIGESSEARYALRMRPEYRYNPIPKANVFRTIVAIESLQYLGNLPAAQDAIQKGLTWLKDRLFHKVHPRAPQGGLWTAHVAIPTGMGLSFGTPDLVRIIDLRHTSQAWSALLLRADLEPEKLQQLEMAVNQTAAAAEPDSDYLWGNIQGSERHNIFASSCCVSFLQCSQQRLHDTRTAEQAVANACASLPERLAEALRPTIKAQRAEEAGRSLWMIAYCSLQGKFQLLRDALERRLKGLIEERTVDSYRAAIRLMAAARAFGWDTRDDWILEGYRQFEGELHPPDFAFVMLALQAEESDGVEERRDRTRRTALLQVALQGRLELYEWLAHANRELVAEDLISEQYSYICALTGEEDLQEWSYLNSEIQRKNWNVLKGALEQLEVCRRRLLGNKINLGGDLTEANRKIRSALKDIHGREVREFLGRVLYTCHRIREYHESRRFPRDVLQSEEHVKYVLGIELEALGFHTGSFEEVLSSGRPDFTIRDLPGSPLEMIVECKFIKEKQNLDAEREEASRDGAEWAREQKKKIDEVAAKGMRQVARYPGPCCRMVFICCLFEEDREAVIAEHGFRVEVYPQGDLELVIVLMNVYFWIRAASRS